MSKTFGDALKGIPPKPSMIRWVCQQDLGFWLANWMADASRPFTAPHVVGKMACGFHLIQEGLGRNGPSEDWPICEDCGKQMIPFDSVGAE